MPTRSPATWAPKAALGLTGVLLTALTVLASLMVWLSYGEVMRATETRAENAARLAAAHVRWIAEAAFQTLRRIDDEVGDRAATFDAKTVGDLAASLSSLPVQVSIWVFNADGQSTFSTHPQGESLNVADRPYFQALRDGAEWSISPLITGRVNRSALFVIARRIERDGRFLGAAIIGVPAELMSEFWGRLNLGPASSVSLIRDDGWLVARHPPPQGPMNLSGHVLFTEHLKRSPSGVYSNQVSPADGVARVVGYQLVEGLPLVAVAGINRDAVLDRFWSGVGSVAVVAVPIALGLLAGAFWVAGLLRRYEQQRRELDAALDRNSVLFAEIHHRVKNNLTTVVSLIQMNALPPQTKRDIRTQIGAMVAVHEQIYLSGQFGTVDLGAYIQRLVGNLRISNAATVKVTCEADPVEVDADRAMPVGLILNEVVTNACKHAFPNGRLGSVAIRVERIDEARARVSVRDDGVGFDIDQVSDGMGTRLLAGLSGQIDAEYTFRRSGGTEFVLTFPLSSPAADAG